MIKNILVAAVALSLFTASCGKSRSVYARNNSVEPNAASDLNNKNNPNDNLNNLDDLKKNGNNAEDLANLNDGKNNILDPNGLPGTGGTPVEHGIAPVYFAFDSAAVAASEDSKCAAIAELLVQHPSYVCIIKGHCDERGSEEYNRALGERRAIAVKDILVMIRPELESRVTTQSMGEEKAQLGAGSDAVWSQDRKGEFEVLDQSKK